MNTKLFFIINFLSYFAYSTNDYESGIAETAMSLSKIIGYTQAQKLLIIDSYVMAMNSKYGPISVPDFNLEETKTRIWQELQEEAEEARSPIILDRAFEELLQKVSKQGAATLRGNIFTISFKGFDIPLIAETREGENVLVLEGINKDPEKYLFDHGPCLELRVGSEQLHISMLATEYKACPIPLQRSGTYLLELSEEIARIIGMSSIGLDDISQVRCEKNDESVSLRLLSIFKHGMSWYGSHGYSSVDGIDEDRRNGQVIRNIPLSDVQELFEKLTKEKLNELKAYAIDSSWSNEDKRLVDFIFQKELFEEFSEIKQLFNDKLESYKNKIIEKSIDNIIAGDFFTWLWQEDCEAYIEFTQIVFPPVKQVKGLGYSYLIPQNYTYHKRINNGN